MSLRLKALASIAVALSLASVGAGAAVIASSTFDSDLEGWLVGELVSATSIPGVPTFVSSGGNPDGFIRTADQFGFNAYLAPSAFLGDWAGDGASSLAFDLRVASSDSGNYATVVIAGGGISISTFGPYPTPNAIWVSYALDLTSAAGWFYSNDGATPGAAVTPADFATVLANVEALRINADWQTGGDQVDLDNVKLVSRDNGGGNGTVPEPATLALFGLGLAGLGAMRRRKLAV